MLTDTKANGAAPSAALQPEPRPEPRPQPEPQPESQRARPAADDKSDALGRIDARLIDNVGVTLEAFLGGARMTVAELTNLKADAVVPLDAALNHAVELRLNGVPVARGELVAVGDKFGVRLVEMAK